MLLTGNMDKYGMGMNDIWWTWYDRQDMIESDKIRKYKFKGTVTSNPWNFVAWPTKIGNAWQTKTHDGMTDIHEIDGMAHIDSGYRWRWFVSDRTVIMWIRHEIWFELAEGDPKRASALSGGYPPRKLFLWHREKLFLWHGGNCTRNLRVRIHF
jgi:hypothetical protein